MTGVTGLFAGIGGIEEGLRRAGWRSDLLSELIPAAQSVLRERFDADVVGNIADLTALPSSTSVVVAGFPCQDLSSVGRKEGITGARSSLVGHVFRLLATSSVEWVVLENVPFLLHLDRGKAMLVVTQALEELGFAWAYRVVDAQAFGLPQRRRRVVLVASPTHDPRPVLFADDVTRPERPGDGAARGFYWTEGTRALGWAVDAVPPIKGGSSVGVPSPPAIVRPDGFVGTPHLEDAERLQGFPAGWTRPAESVVATRHRWRLVGNAVAVPMAEWVGQRLLEPGDPIDVDAGPAGDSWPKAAFRMPGGLVRQVDVSTDPVWLPRPSLLDFLEKPLAPLSARASAGFLRRCRRGSLRFEDGFLDAVADHHRFMSAEAA
ncbi:DNA cytosine methyltransferase [Euzebya rosea]|uniref:DNA cytosine methyltransferase n=1 Tax=Euzebya rosea TaxID=2052804 RepID=UPI000D3E6F2B|nr:DNA (cytosine-5-)-methyltransferase [Euzebya rosea]